MDADDIPHPPLELLVTTNEETGMDGAMELKADHLSGTRLLNLDTEVEGDFLVSCSGGSNIDLSFDIEREANSSKAYKLSISGLKGGHSGVEIDKQRANAIKLAARLLYLVKADVRLASFVGGIKHNAVPGNAEVVFATDKFDSLKEGLDALVADLKEEYRVEDPGLTISFTEVTADQVYTKDLSDSVIDMIMALPDGVQYMSKDIEGLVQTSLNNSVILENDGKLVLTTSVRSASSSSLREILNRVTIIANRMGAVAREYSAYPAWQYEAVSPLRDIAEKIYVEMYGKEPNITSIHAGLECGLLKGILPNTDMISYGPSIFDAHTPKEHMYISSVERVWEYTKKLLAALK